MPALRLTSTGSSRRRRSSHALFTPAKAGTYGIPALQQRPVTFAPNVTPTTYTEVDPADDPTNPLSTYSFSLSSASNTSPDTNAPAQLSSKLFPPSSTPASAPTRKRCPPGKRRSQGYIPRPPNAFMLFRADFVRQKHVPGSIETNHGSLSKIIGTCWRQLPLEEKRVWEVKAKHEKAAHKAMFPDYRFRPVHNKNKHAASAASSSSTANSTSNSNSSFNNTSSAKEKQPTTPEDERRCEAVAALLLEGKKGEELARAVRSLDRARSLELEMEREREEREMEMEEYELGLGLGLSLVDEDGQHRHREQEYTASAMHMPPSYAHPNMDSYTSSFMHSGMSFNTGLNMNMNTTMPMASSSHAGYHRRSSSVPLPNEWQFNHPPQGQGGIALPSLPHLPALSRPASPIGSISGFNQSFLSSHQHQHQSHQYADPFSHPPFHQPSTATSSEYQFAPIPAYTPSAHTQVFNPVPVQSPQPMMGFGFASRSSFGFGAMGMGMGMGQRRASSAQPLLMRSWTMPDEYDFSSSGMGMNTNMEVERDPSPLPDVESGLFADFSFAHSSSTVSSASPAPKAPSACGDEMVDPSSPVTGLGLGLGLDIPPTSHSLARIDTSVSYSPTTVPPSSISASTASSSSACSPLSGVDALPLPLPLPVTSSTSNEATGNGSERMPSLDMSAYMHLDGIYSDSYAGAEQAYDMRMGYYEYDVDPVVKTQSQTETQEGGRYFEESV